MLDLQARGVERGPGEADPLREGRVGAVRRVPHERMSHGRHVHADLVRATRLEVHLEQAGVRERLERVVVRHARAPTADDRHLVVRARVASDRRVNGAGQRIEVALRDRAIDLGRRALLELPLEVGVRRLALGHHHETGRPDIEPVHDPLALRRARSRDPVARGSEASHNGRAIPARTRMCGDADRLVDDHDVVIVVDDAHALDRLGLTWRCDFGQRHLEPGVGDESVRLR
jgi:hypothetical protein